LLKGDSLHAQKFIDPDAKSASQYINFSPKGSATRLVKSVLKRGAVPSPLLKSDPSQDCPGAEVKPHYTVLLSPSAVRLLAEQVGRFIIRGPRPGSSLSQRKFG